MLSSKNTFDPTTLVRKNILNMKPYSSARDEFKGKADVYLDANENPYSTAYNRYPDPLQFGLKQMITKNSGITSSQLFLGNGSDEAIDLLIRAFCEPNRDSVLLAEPTYGMYRVCAEVNAVNVQQVLLTPDFDVDTNVLLAAVDASTKLIFLCSPNNPTGRLLSGKNIEEVLNSFSGILVLDEAYIDFAKTKSFTDQLSKYPNLVVLQTFSKAWGLAGLRLGMCYASEAIISILNKIKHPYNISGKTQELALEALQNSTKKENWVREITLERENLADALKEIQTVQYVYPSDANFLLVRIAHASQVYTYLTAKGIIVRDRSKILGCEDCLRITVGTEDENKKLIQALKEI